MSPEEIEKKVKELIAQELEVPLDKVIPSASFVDDLEADSLAVVELVLALETEFDIEVPDDEDKITTVKDAVEYIKQAVK